MDTVGRFGKRVENYVKYRPSYPVPAIDLLIEKCSLKPESKIADIGSGTGIFTRLLLDQGFRVYGVEPGDDMRAIAERDFADNPNFTSVPNKAEATGLDPNSIDLVTVAQAFHWMDIPTFRTECQRILKSNGHVAIVWNNRKTSGTPFLEDYESLLRKLESDYSSAWQNRVNQESIAQFFGGPHFELHTFPNKQTFDWDGLLGRVLSSSYVPLPDAPGYRPMVESLRGIFDKHSQAGTVTFEYNTEVYLGQIVPEKPSDPAT